MSQYTTGEIAKITGVTVRTVQYYDSRGILIPSDFSEGGRRLYNEDDLRKLRLICFLRELGIPISGIAELLSEPNVDRVINLLFEQQELVLRNEIKERQEQLETIHALQKEMKSMDNFSIENLNDMAYIMKNRKQLRKVRTVMLAIGLPLEVMEVVTITIGFLKGFWLPFGISVLISAIASVGLVWYYYQSIAYICPECHEVFRPTVKEVLFAKHTSKTRKLTCTSCGHKGFCVETYQPIN
ncbi:MAG: MerR family transcriptional regulator [Lachnospiraceae bacterium]|nr:MerR family transcriptional regulator [Lachnospiraceae bacterium]